MPQDFDICTECYGTCKVNCICGGMYFCTRCGNTGEISCTNCNGTGLILITSKVKQIDSLPDSDVYIFEAVDEQAPNEMKSANGVDIKVGMHGVSQNMDFAVDDIDNDVDITIIRIEAHGCKCTYYYLDRRLKPVRGSTFLRFDQILILKRK